MKRDDTKPSEKSMVVKKFGVFFLITLAFVTTAFATTSITDLKLTTNQIEINNLNISETSLSIKQNTSQFVKTIGGGSGKTGALFILQTLDGGYIWGGHTSSYGFGGDDILMAKLNSSGNLLWMKTIGAAGDERITAMKQTSDGGYIASGKITSYGSDTSSVSGLDMLVLKFDSSGNLSWAKTIGKEDTRDQTEGGGNGALQQTSDGGYIMSGFTEGYGAGGWDAFIVKLDSSGNLSWAKTIGGSDNDNGLSVRQTSDGGYIMSGGTKSSGSGDYDIFITKLDSSGNLSWAKAIGGSKKDVAESNIVQTSDGGYAVTGVTKSYADSSGDLFVLKLDFSGNLSWMKAFGEAGSLDYSNSIQQTSDGGYVVGGATGDGGTESRGLLVLKLDSLGNLSWAKKTIGMGNFCSTSFIQQTPDGGYVIPGHSGDLGPTEPWDAFIIKLDSSGNCSGCSLIQDQTSSVSTSDITPTITEVIPEVSSPTPTVTSVTPTVSDVTPEESTLCSATSTFNPLVINASGMIGIGKSNPTKQLDVLGDIRADRFCFKDVCYSAMPQSPWTLYGNNIIFNKGNIGIGTSLPKNKLNIIGDINVTGDYINDQSIGITGNYTTGNCWIYYSGGIVTGTNCSVQS